MSYMCKTSLFPAMETWASLNALLVIGSGCSGATQSAPAFMKLLTFVSQPGLSGDKWFLSLLSKRNPDICMGQNMEGWQNSPQIKTEIKYLNFLYVYRCYVLLYPLFIYIVLWRVSGCIHNNFMKTLRVVIVIFDTLGYQGGCRNAWCCPSYLKIAND